MSTLRLLRSGFNKKLTDLDKQEQKKGGGLTERVIGGEMEGLGLIATPPIDGSIPWLIVKGISDFADEDHGDDNAPNRQMASENAIRLILQAFAGEPLPEARTQASSQAEES